MLFRSRPPGDSSRSDSLHNLALCFSDRYNKQGTIADLEEAITLGRAALELRSPGHSGRANTLSDFAVYLEDRFQQFSVNGDLGEAIALHQSVLDLCTIALSASLGGLSLDSDESGVSYKFMSDIEDVDQELDKSDGVPESLDHASTGKGNPLISEDLVGMEAFTEIISNKNLTKEELQSKLATKFDLLVCILHVDLLSFYITFIQTQYADLTGLNLSACLPPSCSSRIPSISGPM